MPAFGNDEIVAAGLALKANSGIISAALYKSPFNSEPRQNRTQLSPPAELLVGKKIMRANMTPRSTLALFAALASIGIAYAEEETAGPQRTAFFGDLHIHTM